jgi:hypothetical protein
MSAKPLSTGLSSRRKRLRCSPLVVPFIRAS